MMKHGRVLALAAGTAALLIVAWMARARFSPQGQPDAYVHRPSKQLTDAMIVSLTADGKPLGPGHVFPADRDPRIEVRASAECLDCYNSTTVIVEFFEADAKLAAGKQPLPINTSRTMMFPLPGSGGGYIAKLVMSPLHFTGRRVFKLYSFGDDGLRLLREFPVEIR
jgi:hypothetical protein